MTPARNEKGAETRLRSVYLANLFVSLHFYLVIYITSAFLGLFFSAEGVGLLYLVGSLVSLILFSVFVPLLKSFGNVRLICMLLVVEAIALLGLAYAYSTATIIFWFLLYAAVSPVIYLNLDIFVERYVRDERITGGVRGMFLTMINIAQVACPLVAAYLLQESHYGRVYVASVAFLFIAFAIVLVRLSRFEDAPYERHAIRDTLAYVMGVPDLRNVFAAQFLLRFFYGWMVIYVPLYLLSLGFSWDQLGVIFTIMLLPFLILELPLGKFADAWWGEKEIMIIGFIIMVGAIFLMPFLSTSFLLWTGVLFVSRIGASCVEIATESYFFKHVDSSKADTIMLFRIARPATYVAAALVASVSLLFISLQWSFIVLALVTALGFRYSFALADTK
jgi:MFS family permease